MPRRLVHIGAAETVTADMVIGVNLITQDPKVVVRGSVILEKEEKEKEKAAVKEKGVEAAKEKGPR